MKDAKGHGSDGRGGDSSVNDRLKRPQIGLTADAQFSGKSLRNVGEPTDTQRMVSGMRSQLQSGEQHTQAIADQHGLPTTSIWDRPAGSSMNMVSNAARLGGQDFQRKLGNSYTFGKR